VLCADSLPVCEADHTPVVPQTNNSVTCRLNYTRYGRLSPIATLTSSVTSPREESGYFRFVPADPHRNGTISATVMNVAVTDAGIAAINWTAYFAFDVPAQATFKDCARNNVTWGWTSDVIPVWS